MNQGLHVLIEKPFVLDLKEADDILARAEKSGAEVFVGYTQRFRRRYLLAKQAAVAGQLGNIVMAMGKIYVTRAVGEAVAKRSPNTTPSINTLTYMVDLILWYLEGKKPVEVYARAASFVFKKYNRDDFQWMIVTFDDGSVATLGTSWLQPLHWPARRWRSTYRARPAPSTLMTPTATSSSRRENPSPAPTRRSTR